MSALGLRLTTVTITTAPKEIKAKEIKDWSSLTPLISTTLNREIDEKSGNGPVSERRSRG